MTQTPLLTADQIEVSFQMHSRKFGSFKELILTKLRGEKVNVEEFIALKGVSIKIYPGECVAIIGHNGSGKSTLLKVLSGILDPKAGRVSYNGHLTSLIELGAGFDSDLPAKDNVYLGCCLMGYSKKQIDAKFKDIIAFAELESFLDFPLKNYSSGMYARLGFACATAFDPDIVLVDEVLAVGDEAFQAKCHQRVNELKKSGKAIVLVTHDMNAVKNFCERAYVLHHGEVAYEGAIDPSVKKYRELMGLPA